jgi:hypothetical protein
MMKVLIVTILIYGLLHCFVASAYSQNGLNGFRIKSGVGLYNQIPYLFFKDDYQPLPKIGINPEYKPKVVSGIGYFSSIGYQFNTGYTAHLGYDNGMLEQHYNDPLGLFWDKTYRISYQVFYFSFSRQFTIKRFYSSPEIGISYRSWSDDKLNYGYYTTEDNKIGLEWPSIVNRKLNDLGLKVAIDNGWQINQSISLGIRISSEIIGMIPETFFVSPYISIKTN